MLQIRLLGQFDIRLDGKRVMIPTRTAQSLFAYLVLTAGTPHRREKLAGTFWPNTTDDNARKNLRQELWRIRKAFSVQQFSTDDYLIAEELTIAFNRSAPYWLDVAQLERPEIALESLTANLALYQGELLPGFYEDWIMLERERIQSIFETKMEQLLKQLAAAERWMAVQEQGERWLALGHTPEPAYRAVMLAYGARGDMAKVSSIYQRCIEELREQFGLEPSAETRALYDGLLKGVHAPARSAAVQTSGTVTFLFTDIEESTNLLDKLGDQYANMLAEHHEILRVAIQRWNGYEVATQGDAFFVTFARAQDALQCAADAQRGLAAHSWTHNQPPRVRMGVHTGEPLIASTGYVGMDVHRAARIGDAAHGGQVLLSQTTRDLVMHDLPQGMTIRDLGEHRLKDLKFPTPIYQLIIPGLSHDFPPIRTKFTGSEAPTAGQPPFKGLQYFEELDSDLFFGRELLTAKLVNHLSSSQFLSVIIGASGSGKSSLVRAGLIPSLKKGQTLMDGTKPPEGSSEWRVHIITPTAHPLEALAIELTRDSESVTTTSTLMDDLMQDPRSLTLFLIRKYPKHHTLLVLDQFEELFTLCRDEFEREAFIDNLLTTLNQGERHVTLVLTLRADFYAHLAQYPELRDAVAKQQEYIGPMTTEELRRAIEEPARRGHWAFEPGLVDLILRDVGDEPGALPLLSHALLETWKRRAGHTLTLKGYADAGGVHGAIAHTAESMYRILSAAEQAITRNIFLRLTELGEGTEDTRRRTSMAELLSHSDDANEVRAVLNLLAEARLITLGKDTVEVAHEALIREWPTLREWLTQDREGLLLHRQVTEAAHEWELLERDAGSVYRGARLAQAREWAILHPNSLNAGERAFIEASNELEQREQTEREAQIQRELEAAKKLAETQSRAAKQLRRRAVFLTGAFALAIVLAGTAWFFGNQANQNAIAAQENAISAEKNAEEADANAKQAMSEQQIAISRELAAAAISSLDDDPERSVLLALQAEKSADTIEAQNALHRSILESRVMLVLHHDAEVWSVAYSPDGKRIATASQDKTAKIWNAATGELVVTLTGHTASVNGVAFSPDGKRIATSSDDQTSKIWDATTGDELLTLRGHTNRVFRLVFSPDGTLLATASQDGTAKVWDTHTGEVLRTFFGHRDSVFDVAFNPDGKRVATGGVDGNVRVWEAISGKELLTLPIEGGVSGVAPGGVAFSQDGVRVAVAENGSHAVEVWNAVTGEVLLSKDQSLALVDDIAFSPDGKLAATGSLNTKPEVWDAATGKVLCTLSGHLDSVNGIAFSPDGTRLATASWDHTARVWDITPSTESLYIPLHLPMPFPISYSPDGTRIVTHSLDYSAEKHNLKIWDAISGKELLTLSGSATQLSLGPYFAYSPDGKMVAGSSGKAVIVWDAQNGEELFTLSGHTDVVFRIAFNPTGTRLASGSDNGEIIVWDVASGKELFKVQGPTASSSPSGRDQGHYGILSLVYSPDGKHLLSGDTDGFAIIWEAATGKKLGTITDQTEISGEAYFPEEISDAAYSADGKYLALASVPGSTRILDANSGKELLDLKGQATTVGLVVFSPDGKLIATARFDDTVRLWDATSGVNLLTLPLLGGVSFSPDGKRLAVGTESGVQVFVLPINELVALAKSRVTRSLTADECQQYLHVATCPVGP